MAASLFSDQVSEIPFPNEVAFEYKKEFYKVHVNVLIEKGETIYKLYFKNNIEDTDKSIMKLFRNANADGTCTWICKVDYFSCMNNEIAAVVGVAIDSVLYEKNIVL
jgi:hypothetical protein